VVLCPEQIVLFPEIVATGGSKTFTVFVAVLVHPNMLVPVTV
jgi:hypothetical protein